MEYQLFGVQVDPDPDAVTETQWRGRPHLRVPVVAVAEGVLNGGFLPFEEIVRSAPGWNGQPVTVLHPQDDDGNYGPANRFDVLEQYVIGRFLDVEADETDRKLAGAMYFDLEAVEWVTENTDVGELAAQTVDAVRDGERLEVSTGYWHDTVHDPGEFEGQSYEDVQTDVLPDHLAALPDGQGACNWDGTTTTSGCGAPRTQSAPSLSFAVNDDDNADELSPGFRAKVLRALGLSDTETTTEQTPISIGEFSRHMETNDYAVLKDRFGFNCDELEALDETVREKLLKQLDADPDGDGDATTTNDDDDGDVQGDAVEALESRIKELEAKLDAQTEDRRAELVDTITANSDFEADELPESVDKLESLAEKITAQTQTAPNYAGRATSDSDAFDVNDARGIVGGAFTNWGDDE